MQTHAFTCISSVYICNNINGETSAVKSWYRQTHCRQSVRFTAIIPRKNRKSEIRNAGWSTLFSPRMIQLISIYNHVCHLFITNEHNVKKVTETPKRRKSLYITSLPSLKKSSGFLYNVYKFVGMVLFSILGWKLCVFPIHVFFFLQNYAD